MCERYKESPPLCNRSHEPHCSMACVDASFGQHTRALERASRKRTERQQGRPDRLSRPVGPVSRVSPESVVSRDKYHTLLEKGA